MKLLEEKKKNKLYGGSSLFLAARNSIVTDCNFNYGRRIGGTFRVDNFDVGINFDSKRYMKVKQLEENIKKNNDNWLLF